MAARNAFEKSFSFCSPTPGNAAELGRRGRVAARHLAQRDIRKDDVGRHIAFVGERAPNTTQEREERFVALDLAGALFPFRGRLFHLLRERDRRPLTERGAAGFGYLQRGKFPGRDLDQTRAVAIRDRSPARRRVSIRCRSRRSRARYARVAGSLRCRRRSALRRCG